MNVLTLTIVDLKSNNTISNKSYQNNEKVNIGRSIENDLIIKDEYVSKKHCKIFFNSVNWMIENISSNSPTKLNKKTFSEPQQLTSNDVITLYDKLVIYVNILDDSDDLDQTKVWDDEKDSYDDDRTLFLPTTTEDEVINKKEIGRTSDESDVLTNEIDILQPNRIFDFFNRSKKLTICIIIVILFFIGTIYINYLFSNPAERAEQEEQKKLAEIERVQQKEAQEKLEKINHLFTAGNSFFKKKQFTKALNEYNMIVQLDGKNKDAILLVRECELQINLLKKIIFAKNLFDQKKYFESLDLFNGLLTSSNNDDNIKKLQEYKDKCIGKIEFIINEKISEAESLLKERLFDRALFVISNAKKDCLKLNCSNEKRIHHVNALINENLEIKSKIKKLVSFADNLFAKKKYQEALQQYKKVIRMNYKSKKVDYARRKINQTIRILKNEEDAVVLFQNGLTYEELNKIRKAIDCWKQVVELLPESHEYHQKALKRIEKRED